MKTLFVIPGFKHTTKSKQYNWMKAAFKKTYDIQFVDITWDRKVMSDYVQEFTEQFQKHKSKDNDILGFSFGAMIALITAPHLQPKNLYLCSLSPYFKEDLSSLKLSWKRFMGKRRMNDFSTFSMNSIAPNVISKTTIFLGGAEAQRFPTLKARSIAAKKQIHRSQLITIPDAPHDISHRAYQSAIKQALKQD